MNVYRGWSKLFRIKKRMEKFDWWIKAWQRWTFDKLFFNFLPTI